MASGDKRLDAGAFMFYGAHLWQIVGRLNLPIKRKESYASDVRSTDGSDDALIKLVSLYDKRSITTVSRRCARCPGNLLNR